jgi:CRISPR/Cas system-associated exonuclease Cas4 (RecB family)
MNGVFNKFIQGTKLMPKAAIYALTCMQQLSIRETNVRFKSDEAQSLFDKLQKKKHRYFLVIIG